MPRISSSTTPRCLTRTEATRIVQDALHFDQGQPEEEHRFGYKQGIAAIRYDFDDRADLVRISNALQISRTEALIELQRAAHIRNTPAGRVRLNLFEAFMFGGAGGGMGGDYASGYFGAIIEIEQYIRSVH